LVDEIFPFLLANNYIIFASSFEKQDNKIISVCVILIMIVKSIIVNHNMGHKTNNNEDENVNTIWNVYQFS
jgi:hypothetical protein